MLVLERNVHESIEVMVPGWPKGFITVFRAAGGKVRLGFEFPEQIQIVRPDAIRKDPPRDRKVGRK